MNDTCIFCGTAFDQQYGGSDLETRTEHGIRVFGYYELEYDFICHPCSSRTIADYVNWQSSKG